MTVPTHRRETCRLCDGRNLQVAVPLPASPIADTLLDRKDLDRPVESFPLDLYLCGDCGHVQLLHAVSPEVLFSGNFSFMTGNSPAIVQHFQEYAEAVMRRAQARAGSMIVDVGSNDGTFLGFFKANGWRVLGIDPAPEISKKAIDAGIETLNTFLTPAVADRVLREYGPAAVVSANNVFAHADDLAAMTDSIRRMLAPDGIFVFEVSYLADVVDKYLLGTIFHEHLSYHSVKPLRTFLQRHGLELIDAERVPQQGGSLIGTAQPLGGPRSVSPAVAELVQQETARGLDRPESLAGFSRGLSSLKHDLWEALRGFQAQGKTIAGFGAARSSTLMISYFELGNVLQFIVDDNPSKQNKFTPVGRVPILPTRALYERKPDVLLILAWVHAEAIMRAHKAYGDQGGRFIVCFPKVEVKR